MTLFEKYGEDWKNVVLQDNNLPFGGIAFVGETLGDFLDEEVDPTSLTMEELNRDLEICGIRAV